MFALPEDLLVLAGNGGRPFEEFLFELIVAECSRHGIPPDAVHWDSRTNLGDGGRDITIAAGHTDPDPRFIPQRPSIWSAKSGRDGTQPATIRAELIHDGHHEVRRHLQRNEPYVWCTLQPMSEDERSAMQKRVRQVAEDPEQFPFNPNFVEFRGLTDLCALLNEHPGLIPRHLPGLARVFNGVRTLDEWSREDAAGFATPWVDFGGRSHVVEQIREHLRARSGPNVLHLAGLSGVGKTRTVLEACRNQRDLQEVYYVPRFTALRDPFLAHLTRGENRVALVVIDEVPLEELRIFSSRVGVHDRRLRFVTIGPARRDQRERPSESFHVLAEPDTRAGVLEVVRQAGSGLTDPVLESIAHFSAHDLRLALMLVEATRRDGAFVNLPIANGMEVWERVTTLFRKSLRDPSGFRKNYPLLTIGVDIGFRGEHRRELEYVAAQFCVPAPRLDEAAAAAVQCGLGVKTPSFFEPTPRALAGHLFRSWIWDSLRPRLSTFMSGLNERLLRRFVERCQDYTGEERGEVEAALAEFFRVEVGEPDVKRLIDRERSRLFKAWAELDPGSGLAWLQEAVGCASDADLAALDGKPNGSGGWRGRRQVVWLCEALASFGEHFWECEAVLHRLAQVETEPAIGNNSTAIWRALFQPALAFTEIPFPPRADLLLRRLREADHETLPLVLSAAVEALGLTGGRMAPPSVVGGRLAPDPWKPATYGEIFRLQQDLGRRLLAALPGLDPPLRAAALRLVVGSLRVFVGHNLVPELRAALGGAEDLKEVIRLQLAGLVASHEQLRARQPDPSAPSPVIKEVRVWMDELAPPDLAGQVRELTAHNYWDVVKPAPEEATTKADPYAKVAQEVLLQPEVMGELADWLNSDGPKSALQFGYALGRADAEDDISPVASGWLEGGLCRSFLVGYLRGVAARVGGLPGAWSAGLDRAAGPHPEHAVALTLEVDFTQAGFRRLMSLLEAERIPFRYLVGLWSAEWERVLSIADRAEVLNAVLARVDRDPQVGFKVGLTLAAGWSGWGRNSLPPELLWPAFRLLDGSLRTSADVGGWSALLESFAATHPAEAATLAMASQTTLGPSRLALEDAARKVLMVVAGVAPEAVMEAFGGCLLDPQRRPFFGILRFPGLLEAIGLLVVQRWVRGHDPDLRKYIARHLESPSLQDGSPFVPPVTAWFFAEYEGDDHLFREFCAGRHSGEIRVGSARDRRPAVEAAVGPFLDHPLRRVREWARYELAENEYESELDERMDEQAERL